MSKNKTKKGITLISLVITIILLLILATVAISLAVDSDGLFSKAGDAANKWNTSVAEEERIINELLNYDSPVKSYVTETSEVAGVKKERTAPIPKGYVASEATGENTIAGGLVIYETETVVNDTNHDDAMEDYNQYVWIPVDEINDMVMCKECGGSVKNLVYNDTNQTLICSTENHIETPTLVGKLYIADTEKEGDVIDSEGNTFTVKKYNMDFTQSGQEFDTERWHEPAALEGDEATLLPKMQSDFNSMAKSVAKYGGFYISRYEVGEGGASKKGQTVLVNSGDTNWYTFQSMLGKTKTNTTSQMIWGCEYDQVIKFIGDEAKVGHGDRNLSFEPSGAFVAGNNSYDEMMNIYDLEGNVFEWTAEAYNIGGRAHRGGYFFPAWKGLLPASNRDTISPTYNDGCFSSRAALYVNL